MRLKSLFFGGDIFLDLGKQLRQKIVRLSILQFRDLDQSLDTVGALSVVVHGWGKAQIPFAVDDM